MFLILGFVLLTYIATGNVLTTQDEHVIPSGDPFTYTLSFIQLHDLAHDSLYQACQRALGGNWYWLQNIAILALSPVLGRDPVSMAAMNYLYLAISLCALYAVGRQFTRLPPVALLGIAGLVHLPWMYGPNEHGQLLCVSLDCSFLWMVATAWSCLFLYALEPASSWKALFAALTTSLAICGRGNSLPIVALVLGVPLLEICRLLFKRPRAGLVKPAAVYLLLTSLLVGFYLWCNLSKILNYYDFMRYEQDSGLLNRLWAMCRPPRWVAWNIPSMMMLGNTVDTTASLVTSVAMHIFMLATGAGLLWHSRRMQEGGRALALLVTSMLASYFATYGLGSYAVRGVEVHRPYHMFNMMLLSFSVMLMAGIVVLLRRRAVLFGRAAPWIAGLAGTSAFVFAVMFSKLHARAAIDLACASPSEVRAVSVALDRITAGRPLAVIWYRQYNPVIFNYYRFLEGLPHYHTYSEFHFPMFHTIAEQIDPSRFHRALRTTLEEAHFVIVPQNPEYCEHIYPCRLQRDGKAELSAFYADPDRPDYRVRMVLHDAAGMRLLLLERLEERAAPGTPLVLPRPFHGLTEEMAWDGVLEDKASTKPAGPPIRFYVHALQDASPQSFWEGYGPFPHALRAEHRSSPIPVASYRLCADAYEPVRMPTAWRVEGSNDLREWVELDRRSDVQWSAGQSQEFGVEAPVAFRFFQFVFETGQEGIVRLGDVELYAATASGKQPVPADELRLSIPTPNLAKADGQPSLR